MTFKESLKGIGHYLVHTTLSQAFDDILRRHNLKEENKRLKGKLEQLIKKYDHEMENAEETVQLFSDSEKKLKEKYNGLIEKIKDDYGNFYPLIMKLPKRELMALFKLIPPICPLSPQEKIKEQTDHHKPDGYHKFKKKIAEIIYVFELVEIGLRNTKHSKINKIEKNNIFITYGKNGKGIFLRVKAGNEIGAYFVKELIEDIIK